MALLPTSRVAAGLATAGALLALVPATAGASSASLSGGTLVIRGGPEASDISISMTGNTITDTAGITAGAGCESYEPTKVACEGDYNRVDVALGDGNDRFAGGWLLLTPAVVLGEGGNDTMWTDGGDDRIVGGDGNDDISGVGARDTLEGGPGNDTLNGGPGDDVLDAGPGLDSVRADGNIAWEDGNDQLLLRDNEADRAQCGLGADTVVADAIDVLDGADCESVDVPAPPPVEPRATPAPSAGAMLVLLQAPKRARIRTVLSRGLRVTCDFLEAGSFVARLKSPPATSKRLGLGRRTVVLAKAGGPVSEDAYAVRLKVRKARYRKALRRARRISLIVDVTGTNAAGSDRETEKVVLVR